MQILSISRAERPVGAHEPISIEAVLAAPNGGSGGVKLAVLVAERNGRAAGSA
jgi:hypothetical protein